MVLSYTISFFGFGDYVSMATLNTHFSSVCTLRLSLPSVLRLTNAIKTCPAQLIGSHVRDLSLPWLCDIDVQLLSDLPKLQRVAFQCVSLSPYASFMNWNPPSSLTHVTIPGSSVKVFNGWVSRLSLISLEILEQDVVDFNREECHDALYADLSGKL